VFLENVLITGEREATRLVVVEIWNRSSDGDREPARQGSGAMLFLVTLCLPLNLAFAIRQMEL
jgi:hypothetical protein